MSSVEEAFPIGTKVRSERGAEGVVEDIIYIEGKPYIQVRWRNGSWGVYGREEIKRYRIVKVA
jgi:hypothetical protein